MSATNWFPWVSRVRDNRSPLYWYFGEKLLRYAKCIVLLRSGGCFTNVSWALQNIQCQKSHLWWEFQAETLYVCPKPCFGHTHKVSAWNSYKKFDFCNTQIAREYLGELAKRLWNNPLVVQLPASWPGMLWIVMAMMRSRIRRQLTLLLRVKSADVGELLSKWWLVVGAPPRRRWMASLLAEERWRTLLRLADWLYH